MPSCSLQYVAMHMRGLFTGIRRSMSPGIQCSIYDTTVGHDVEINDGLSVPASSKHLRYAQVQMSAPSDTGMMRRTPMRLSVPNTAR